MKLHSLTILIGTFIIGISFTTALAFHKKAKPTYFRYVFAFIILGLLMSVNTITSNYYTWRFGLKSRILIEQLLILLQYIMLYLFFVDLMKKSAFVKKIKWLFLLSLPPLIGLIFIVHIANVEIRSSILPNLILLVFCFYYLKDLMNNKPTLVLIHSSAFWLVMGIFFSSCICFPVGSMMPFISKDLEYSNLRYQIFSIYNMSVIILYLFIIKSYICLMRPQNL